MKDYEKICHSCFQEKPGPGACPRCGFNEAPNPEGTLPLGTLLHGRYMTGKVIQRSAEAVAYNCLDLTLENRLVLHEYAPSDVRRAEDKCTVVFEDEAQRYDRKKEAREFGERAKVLLRGKEKLGGPTLTDLFEENETTYYVTEQPGTNAGAAPGATGTTQYGQSVGQVGATQAAPGATQAGTAYGQAGATQASPGATQAGSAYGQSAGQSAYQPTTYGQQPAGAPAGRSSGGGKPWPLIIGAIAAAAVVAILAPILIHNKNKKAEALAQQQQQQQVTPAPQQTGTPAPQQTGTPAPQQTGTPAPQQTTPEPTETPAPTETPTPAPVEVHADTPFSSERLAYQLNYPKQAVVEENNNYMDFFTIDDGTRLIVSYNYYADMPLYSVENVQKDPERALAAVMGEQEYTYEGTENSEDNQMVATYYSIDADDGEREGFVIFVNSNNPPGVYELTGVTRTGSDYEETLWEMVGSFKQTGDVQHGLDLLGGEEYGLRAFVMADRHAGTIESEDTDGDLPLVRVNLSVNRDGFVTMRRFRNPEKTAKPYLENLVKTLTESQGFQVTQDIYEMERNHNTFYVAHLVQQAGDQSYPIIFAAADIDGAVIALSAEQIIKADQTEVSDEIADMFAWLMDTVEPL